jgi:hypothetical protein
MAGYHYKLHIVPHSYEIAISDEYEEYYEFWKKEEPHKEMLEKFRTFLPLEQKFGYGEEFRSDINYSVLYIWRENNLVDDIMIEFSPPEKGDILTQLLDLCVEYDYLLFSEDTNAKLLPNKKSLWEDLKRCSRFHIFERRMNKF